MKQFTFLMFFLLAGLVRADVPAVPPVSNPPDGQFFIITYSTGDYYAVLDSFWMDYIITFSFDSYEEATRAADLVRGAFSSTGEILGVLPIRSGSSDVLEWRLFLDSGGLIEQSDVMTFFSENSISFTSSDWVSYSEGCLVEYGELEEPPEPTVPDCVYTVVDGEILYVFPESPYPSGAYAEAVRGPALYATTKEAADACVDGFGAFLSSYDWPWVGVPAVMPWTSPKVYKCIERFNGQNVGVFYRIVFQNYLGTGNDAYDTAYGQCLNDYAQVCGCGGLNVFQCVKPSAVLNDDVIGISELNGRTLASASAGAAEPLSTVSSDVNFVQYTAQKVSSEDDVTGESVVTSTASASEGATINITNNTEVTTNLELGDAPASDSFSTDEDGGQKEVKDSEELLSNEETRYTYIDSSSTEKKIDWQKFWDDFKGKLSEIFGFEKVERLFQQEVDSSPLQDWNITVFGQSFVLPWSVALNCQPIAIARSMLSAFCMLGTFFACFRLLA